MKIGIPFICLAILCHNSDAFLTSPSPTLSTLAPKTKGLLVINAQNEGIQELLVREEQVNLSTGVSMQVQWSQPVEPISKQQPPLIFLHGSFHGGWCWVERYFPYFVDRGYPVVALNWRGTGGTFAGEGVRKVKMQEHVLDLNAFLDEFVPRHFSQEERPILISHSFGGLSIMKYLEEYPEKASAKWGGAVIMCSVPPSGNGAMTMRFLRRSFKASWKITAGLAMKRVTRDANLCRDLFFGGPDDADNVSDDDVLRYMDHFRRDSAATIDLLDLAKKLPSARTDANGRAPFVSSRTSSPMPPFLVVGATRDYIVDREGVQETATYFGLDEPVMVDSPHDVMIGKNFEHSAGEIHQWVQDVVLGNKNWM